MSRILLNVSHGIDIPDRPSAAFTLATAAIAAEHETVVSLTIEGVYLAQKGYSDAIHAPPFERLKDLMDLFLEGGGKLWVCQKCMKRRSISPDSLIPGSEVVSATRVIEFVAPGISVLSF
ncbi:MAG: sulfur reduction protein DsrE [Chloroflexaceae bacterium]|nr:sulfur reduction protein DsrE [Chloroflexaceae bacterium]